MVDVRGKTQGGDRDKLTTSRNESIRGSSIDDEYVPPILYLGSVGGLDPEYAKLVMVAISIVFPLHHPSPPVLPL